MQGAFDPPDIAVNRTCFPHMDDVIASIRNKKLKMQEE